MMKRIRQSIINAFWIVVVAAVIGVVFNMVRLGGIPFMGDWSPKAVTEVHAGDLEVIGLDDAFQLFEKGKALFIDAREPGDFTAGHIQGSVNIPVESAAEHLDEVRAMLKTGKTVIAYCYDVNCPLGADLVKDLRNQGIGPVKVMPEGWLGWMDGGIPMNEPMQVREGFMDSNPMQVILSAVRVVLGALFLYAGAIKIVDPAAFALAVYNYHILPAWLVNVTAIILPWVEVVAGILLVLGLWIPGGALIVSAMLLVFTTALGFNLSRGLDIACGCFSTAPTAEKITWWYLLRDSSLMAASFLVLFADHGRYSLQRALFRQSRGDALERENMRGPNRKG